MALKFGTSGLRGPVVAMTDPVVARYAAGFIDYINASGEVLIGRDLRESSERIAHAVAAGVRAAGAIPVDCSTLPTPALACAAASRGLPAIMVTGSHIPADRNGLKFYTSDGEIGKEDEAGITAAFAARNDSWAEGAFARDDTPLARYRARFADAFSDRPLSGLRIGVYQHSSVARDLLIEVLGDLGADVSPLGRSDRFVPVDTEAVSTDAAARLRRWSRDFDAIVSTDGDGDRPMVADETGRILPGDVLGPITARGLGADVVVTPVTSNSLVCAMGVFDKVIRTQVGSPFVIDAMEKAQGRAVVGYEANGGFLLGFTAGDLTALMTRDCMLPIIVPLSIAASEGKSLSALRAELPPIFTAADRLQDIEADQSQAVLAALHPGAAFSASVFEGFGAEVSRDLTDGLRISFADNVVIHLRPSGNAPELRCYAEAAAPETAARAVTTTLERIKERLDVF